MWRRTVREILEVTYALEKSDYLQYNKFVISRVPALKWQVLFRFFFVPAVIGAEFFVLHLAFFYALIFLGVALGWVSYLLWVQRRTVIAQAQARPGALGLHTVSLQPDGFYSQSAVQDTRVKWQNITEVADSPQMIAFFLSPRFGFIVPKRAFADPAQAQAFLETARAYRRSAYDGTPPVLPDAPVSWPPAPQRML